MGGLRRVTLLVADRTVAAFAARLQDTVDPDSIQAELASTVRDALEPVHLSVWLN